MLKLLTVLITLGSFCTLAAYSSGKYTPIRAAKAMPVSIKRDAARCIETDWVCLIAWAAEEHPVKRGKRQ
jgi:hypothetical protein